jgi:hypothetical protein
VAGALIKSAGLLSVSVTTWPMPGVERNARTPSGAAEFHSQRVMAARGCEIGLFGAG